jgi:hypothetical protein
MEKIARKRSPRAPSIALDEALDRVLKLYAAEGKHTAPIDVVARHLGYSAASNGTAATMLASLRYFGLLVRPKEGMLQVSNDVETYKFAPTDSTRAELLRKWVSVPPVFSELLSKYSASLPSPATLKFDLIQMGFSATAADDCLTSFLRSVEFANYFSAPRNDEDVGDQASTPDAEKLSVLQPPRVTKHAMDKFDSSPNTAVAVGGDTDVDRIPIRLSGGRRAWLIVPTPFYDSDKSRIKQQIDLLLTDDDAA